MRAIFLDRDGTLVKDYPDEEWRNVTELEIYPDTIEALQSIPNHFKLFIVSNQYLIHEGFISFDQFRTAHRQFLHTLKSNGIHIEHTYFCPHARTIKCHCRKPSKGLIEQCLVNYDVELPTSYFIGDSEIDIQLGKSVGSTTIAVRDFGGKSKPTHYARTLREAVKFIVNT